MPPLIEFILRIFQHKLSSTKFGQKYFNKKKNNHRSISLIELDDVIRNYPISIGDSLMIHSSLGSIDLTASELISYFRTLIGESGTLLMPTHPVLEKHQEYYIYDILNSKSGVGYLTEYFRNSKGTIRSKHPYASIAAQGPKAEYYLRDNLGNNKLPHGVDSAYHKFCLDGGKVLCIGVSAIGRATVKHVAEEVLDEDYPLKNIFEIRSVKIKENEKSFGVHNVRVRTNQLIPFLAKSRLKRDWKREKITLNNNINGLPVDYLDAKKCYEWMYRKAREGYIMYPFAKYSPKFRSGNKK